MTGDERIEVASLAAVDAVVTQAPAFIADLDAVGVAELRALLLAAWTRGARFMVAEISTEREHRMSTDDVIEEHAKAIWIQRPSISHATAWETLSERTKQRYRRLAEQELSEIYCEGRN